MAKKMDYSTGALDLKDTVWFPVEPNVNVYGLHGRTTWLGFQSEKKAKETLLYILTNGASGVKHQPVGEKSYNMSATQVLSFAMVDQPGANLLERLSAACYVLAASVKDVDTGEPNPDYDPTKPTSPTNTKNVMVSFFHNATDVNISPGG